MLTVWYLVVGINVVWKQICINSVIPYSIFSEYLVKLWMLKLLPYLELIKHLVNKHFI